MYNGTQLYEKKILIVDDDFGLNQTIKTILSNNGFKYLSSAYSIEEAIELLSFMEFSLILLDVMLPDGEGYQLAKYVRKDLDIPIIFLTAKNNPKDEIEGFVSGGDDYITKPFLPKNLVYRVIALLNRVYKNSVDTIHLDKNTYIDLANAQVIKKNEKISLTPTELRIIEKLIDNQNRILSNESLFDIIWGGNSVGYDKVLKVHIRHIREKIEDNPSQPTFLQTIRGLGYKLIIN